MVCKGTRSRHPSLWWDAFFHSPQSTIHWHGSAQTQDKRNASERGGLALTSHLKRVLCRHMPSKKRGCCVADVLCAPQSPKDDQAWPRLRANSSVHSISPPPPSPRAETVIMVNADGLCLGRHHLPKAQATCRSIARQRAISPIRRVVVYFCPKRVQNKHQQQKAKRQSAATASTTSFLSTPLPNRANRLSNTKKVKITTQCRIPRKTDLGGPIAPCPFPSTSKLTPLLPARAQTFPCSPLSSTIRSQGSPFLHRQRPGKGAIPNFRLDAARRP
jgi:hypothetical protein